MKLRPSNQRGSKKMLNFSLLSILMIVLGFTAWPSLIVAVIAAILGKYILMLAMIGVYLFDKAMIKLLASYLKKLGLGFVKDPDFIKVAD